MSQTLSLPPGKYSLFITPPVAGVDFTGTPTPSVSYQWKKNGAAVSGQTATTISGVFVGQTGGTVDLADGDTISIDIILTNLVQVTVKTISATIDASIPAPVIAPVTIRQLVGSQYQTVTALANTDIGEQVIVANNAGGTVTTTPPALTTYQWRRGFGPIAGATLQSYTIQAADADSIIDCVVSATNSGGTTTRTASVVVGTLPDAGWTELTPSADSRLIYVATDGNDVAAAAAKGRGYYLPSDPEIGADPTNPVGPIVAWRSQSAVNGSKPEDPAALARWGHPDWILFRRGSESSFGSIWGKRGRSLSEPFVYAAWGPPSESRPRMTSGLLLNRRGVTSTDDVNVEHVVVAGIDFDLRSSRASQFNIYANHVLIEDCRFVGGAGGTSSISNFPQVTNVRFRRCVVADTWNASAHNQGLFTSGTDSLLIEECVFDRNGYKEDPNNPSTWTRGVMTSGMAAGTGVQPNRDFYSRNLYLTGETPVPPTLRGNIISRGAGGSSVQMRQGGIAERNLFIWNEQALVTGSGQQAFYKPQPSRPNWIGYNATEKKYRFNSQTQQFDPSGDVLRVPTPGVDFTMPGGTSRVHVDAVVADNLVLHDDHMLPPGGWGIGVETRASRYLAVTGNVLAHFHRGVNSHWPGSGLGGIPENNSDYYPYPTTLLETGIFTDNAVLRQQGGSSSVGGLLNLGGGAPRAISAFVGGNAVAATLSAPKVVQNRLLTSGDHEIGTAAVGGNLYLGTTSTPFQYRRPDGSIAQGSFSQYRDETGWESESAAFGDFGSFKAAAGWTAPERDIVSYMQSIDPTFVPDENVTVDQGVPADQRRPNAPRVWEVLTSSAYGGHSSPWNGDALGGDVANAKLIARRYHAFLVFIERAKENRKGAWDPRWTAEAVNNYIRAGFGKAAVTGAYDTRSLTDRLLDYTT